MKAPADRTGVLIVRLWIEASHETGLRARITQTLDSLGTEQTVAVAASAEDICAIIKQWVEDFATPPAIVGNGDPKSLGNSETERTAG